MKSSRAISCVICLYETDVSRTIWDIRSMMMMMMMIEMVLETSVAYRHLSRLIAREDFIKSLWKYLYGGILDNMLFAHTLIVCNLFMSVIFSQPHASIFTSYFLSQSHCMH
jgi:hypothetical protein